ncbi:hypothetical protein [Microbacterium sp. NPDC056052]|uniref:hypothetical protein n=1 Tax=Microbacterium sp. NPDC056052 TaxID=3345695 RepID=UPI0035D549CC
MTGKRTSNSPTKIHTAHGVNGTARDRVQRRLMDAVRQDKRDTIEHPDPAVVQAALVRSRLMPTALGYACPRCGTEAGSYCAGQGVCGARATLARRALATA